MLRRSATIAQEEAASEALPGLGGRRHIRGSCFRRIDPSFHETWFWSDATTGRLSTTSGHHSTDLNLTTTGARGAAQCDEPEGGCSV